MSIAITTGQRSHRAVHLAVLGALGVLVLAGCGSSGSGGGGNHATTGSGGNQAAAGSGGTTLTVRSEAGRSGVLATADGRTLYESTQEHRTVLCKSSACTTIGVPLTVAAGQTPTAPSQVSGTLGTIMRPDGMAQVALDGKPLYTFSVDQGAGQVKGDGVHDSFDGTDFTWQVATATGGAAPAPSVPAPSAPASSAAGSSGSYTY
jgi:predicted lipoprotein with Yx(FWY)xxD motif